MSGATTNGDVTVGKEKTEFLDSGQYTVNGITRYEKIFGRNYVSEGGLQSTQVGWLTSTYTLLRDRDDNTFHNNFPIYFCLKRKRH